MSVEAKITKNPDVVYRDVGGGGGVLLHLESGTYHGLNSIGSVIWELIDGETTRAKVVADLRVRLESPPPHLEGDVTTFLDGLRERNLIAES
jgi:hypothetical protein